MIKAIAIYKFDAKSGERDELSLKKNDILDVIEKDDGWWEVRNAYGKSGLVPVDYIAAPVTEDMKVLLRGKTTEDHEATTDEEVTVKKGCQVAILCDSDENWWFVGFSGKTGYIPKEKIRPFKDKDKTSNGMKKQHFEVAPDKAHCEENATILISFKHKLPEDAQFIVVFTGDHCEKVVDAEKYNEFTIKAITPKYHPAESTKISVSYQKDGKAPTTIGKGVEFIFESRIDLVHRLLVTEADPMSFLRSSFQIENTQNVDHILSGLVEKRIPEGFNALKSRKNVTVLKEDHPKETPTLLHFAAFYNLTKLAKTLLECAGAEEALQVKNCHGMLPDALAEFRKNEELAKVLRDNKSGSGENHDQDIYQEMENVYERYTKMDHEEPSGYVTARLRPSTSSEGDTEIYEDMASSNTSEPEEHYDCPRPGEDRFDEGEEIYDEVNNDKFEKEQAIRRKIEEFKVYGRMTEKEVQLALIMKRVKERYITQEQALEMARVLRLEPQVGAPPVKRKPQMKKKNSAPLMGELTKKVQSLPRTFSTSSGSSMSSVGSNGSVASSGYTSGETDRVKAAKSLMELPTSSRNTVPVPPKPAAPRPAPRKSAPPTPGRRGHP